ncbi:conserved hypothetical protein [Thiomonas sp. X19]|jgi:hypothetical protein|uniref:IrrE N-terminal-like domain-containing protein n=2 Tax=Thiomonas TaxID=32012 RepID=A0A238D2E1_THIDL|nr:MULTISPECIES: hypothetical protein [Thiomonas]SBP87447.1 conserved hypothetical protein [Thiomonas delicata]SCC91818.1 conserved hypothetical protein [Thiomonas sp. X19]
MPERWSITPEWAQLETGSPEERAGFAALGIYAYDACLTEGHDRLLQSIRRDPYLSAYHFAEWLAWNWWRLRWEPHKKSPEWELSHAMASIGGGYIWPNIHIVSDGQAVTLVSKPTPERARTPYRYITDSVSVITAADFESEVDLFIEAVLQRLQTRQVADSNLSDIWQHVLQERQDPTLSMHRKLEALLSEDPGEVDEALLNRFLSNGEATGQTALEEIAANRIPGKAVPDVTRLLELGHERGAVTNPQDCVTLRTPIPGDLDAAWKVGTRTAQLLRAQENMDQGVAITNDRLADMYGAPRNIFNSAEPLEPQFDLSFVLSESKQRNRVVLRSKWDTGRRFEIARLLGDTLIRVTNDPMRPATRSDTYRQKVQRAFAAELLSPFQAVETMLNGDYSMENQQDVAHYFQVSSLTIRTLLVNHKRIDRSELDGG